MVELTVANDELEAALTTSGYVGTALFCSWRLIITA
jgi:hypothetical protein